MPSPSAGLKLPSDGNWLAGVERLRPGVGTTALVSSIFRKGYLAQALVSPRALECLPSARSLSHFPGIIPLFINPFFACLIYMPPFSAIIFAKILAEALSSGLSRLSRRANLLSRLPHTGN